MPFIWSEDGMKSMPNLTVVARRPDDTRRPMLSQDAIIRAKRYRAMRAALRTDVDPHDIRPRMTDEANHAVRKAVALLDYAIKDLELIGANQ